MIELEAWDPNGTAVRYAVEEESCIIGRSQSCDMVVRGSSLSRRHARLFLGESGWMVEDLGSRNGTFLNGARVVEPMAVAAGDSLRLGSAVIVVRVAGEPAVEPPSQTLSVLKPASTYLEQVRSPLADREELERFAERMRIVNEVHSALAAQVSEDDLLELILDRVFQHLKPEHGVVVVRRGGEWVRAVERRRAGAGQPFPTSHNLLEQVAEGGLAALVLDTATDERFGEAASILDAGVRSLVAAPLLSPDGPLGMIALSSSLAVRQFCEADLELLVALASAAGLRMRNIVLAEEAAERRQLAREVALARRIQEALLPATMPSVPGIELYCSNVPSRGVSGDYYQVVETPNGELAVLVADVSGKGIAASLITAYVDAVALTSLGSGLPPEEVLAQVSIRLHRKTPTEQFATAFLGFVDLSGGRLRWASAGHEPAALVRAGGDVELLERTGLPLGLLPDAELVAQETVLMPADLLMVYTDGLNEASDPSGTEFGRGRLVEIVREHRQLSLPDVAERLQEALEAFVLDEPFHDDRTLVLLRWTGSGPEAPPRPESSPLAQDPTSGGGT